MIRKQRKIVVDVTPIVPASKSLKESDEIIVDKEEKVLTTHHDRELAKISPVVDNIHDSADTPYGQNTEIISKTSSVGLKRRGESCKKICEPVTSCAWLAVGDKLEEKFVSSVMEKNKSIKRWRSPRVSCRSKENVSPTKAAKTGKVATGKPTRSAFMSAKHILLRSSRKKVTSILKKNILKLGRKMHDDDKIDTSERNGTGFHSADKVITEKSGTDSASMNLENERQQKISDSLSITQDVSVSQDDEKKDNVNDQIVSMNETTKDLYSMNENIIINSPSGSLDLSQNITPSKKNCQKEKRGKMLKNKCVNNLQTQNLIPMQNNNDYKCFSGVVERRIEQNHSKLNDVSLKENEPKEHVIILTPSLNADVRSEYTTIVRKETEEFCRDDEDSVKLGNAENEIDINFPKTSSMTIKKEKNAGKLTEAANSENEIDRSMFKGKYSQCLRKKTLENYDDTPRRKLRHVNTQAMPGFQSKIAMLKNDTSNEMESVVLQQKEKEKSDHAGHGKREQEEEVDPLAQNSSTFERTDKSKDSKHSYHLYTDSDETLSNVESIESVSVSPTCETLSITPKDNSNMSKKEVAQNSEVNNLSKTEFNSILQRLPATISITNITNGINRDLKSAVVTRKHSIMEVSSNSSCDTKKQKSGSQDGIEFLSNENLFGPALSSKKLTEDIESQDNLTPERSVSWLRHYERPRKTQIEMIRGTAEFEESKRNIATFQKTRDIGDPASENLQRNNKPRIGGYLLKEQDKNISNMNNQTFIRKRGRPRKQSNEQSNQDLNKNKKAQPNNTNSQLIHHPNSPTGNLSNAEVKPNRNFALDGSALTIAELQHLFFKFIQHGHFRTNFEQPEVNIQNNHSQQNYMMRMQCYDQKEYYMSPNYNLDQTNFENMTCHPQLQKCSQTNNNSDGIYRTDSSNFGQIDHRFGSTNPHLRNKFSGEFARQMPHSRNTSPCSTQVSPSGYENVGAGVTDGNNVSTNDANSWNYNSNIPANENLSLNCIQSGYTNESNYQHDFHNKNNTVNVADDNLYSNCHTGIINSNDLKNNGNIGGTDSVNYFSSTNNIVGNMNFDQGNQNQCQNSMALEKMDSTMSDGNRISHSSIISMRNNSSMDDLNADWNLNGANQQLNSTNEYLMDRNTMSHNNESSQAMDAIPDLKNLTYDSKLIMNGSNFWMNRSNSTRNAGFSVMRPWPEPLPVYNPYLDNDNLHYGNIFSPCGTFMGFSSSNYPFLNGGSNADPWIQNTFSSTGDGNSAIHIPSNHQFSGMSSGLYQANDFSSNNAINLSMPNDALNHTTTEATNMIDPNSDNLDISNSNQLNSTVKQILGNPATLIETNGNNKLQDISQISDPYSFELHENWKRNIHFNGTDEGVSTDVKNNAGIQQQENLLRIHDCLDNFEDCFDQNYNDNDSSNCKTVVAQSHNSETELSKLRQELADFTKQYSKDQMSPDSTRKWFEHSNDDGKI